MSWQPLFPSRHLRTADWMLPAMILVGFFVHGLAFYLIQSSAPASRGKEAISSRLSVLDVTRPSDAALLRWIDNHDPAVITRDTQAPEPPAALSGEPYKPSYEQVLPEPLPVVDQSTATTRTSLFPPGPVPEVVSESQKPAAPIVPELDTKIDSSASLIIRPAQKIAPPATGKTLPQPTRIFVVSSPTSATRFFFLTESSGDEKLDAYAKAWLETADLTFVEDTHSGWTTFNWGAEVWKSAAP